MCTRVHPSTLNFQAYAEVLPPSHCSLRRPAPITSMWILKGLLWMIRVGAVGSPSLEIRHPPTPSLLTVGTTLNQSIDTVWFWWFLLNIIISFSGVQWIIINSLKKNQYPPPNYLMMVNSSACSTVNPLTLLSKGTWRARYLSIEGTHRQGAPKEPVLAPPLATADHTSQGVDEQDAQDDSSN